MRSPEGRRPPRRTRATGRSAESLERRVGQRQRHDRLADHRRRGHGAHVAALERDAVAPAVSRSTLCSGSSSVAIGFIATRTTIGSPVDMPPSMPPARLRPRPSRRRVEHDLVVHARSERSAARRTRRRSRRPSWPGSPGPRPPAASRDDNHPARSCRRRRGTRRRSLRTRRPACRPPGPP